jgi:hypothetical protein
VVVHRSMDTRARLPRQGVSLANSVRIALGRGHLGLERALRSGAARLSDVRELRPKRLAQNVELLSPADGSSLMVLMMKDFLPFVNDIAREAPDLPVKVRPFFSRLSEKWPLQGDGGYDRGP